MSDSWVDDYDAQITENGGQIPTAQPNLYEAFSISNRVPGSNNKVNHPTNLHHQGFRYVPPAAKYFWNSNHSAGTNNVANDDGALNKLLQKTVTQLKNEQEDIETQQQDPSSVLHSSCSFANLNLKAELLKALELMGFYRPSRIQEKVLPILLGDPPRNLIAQSQSGTGKTAAFSLTMLSRLDPSKNHPQCLCLVPTLELAHQTASVIAKMAQFLPEVKIHLAIRGNRASRNEKLTDHIIVGTPGTSIDLLRCSLFDPSKIICLVLDEADEMIQNQNFYSISLICYEKICSSSPNVQTMLFSATYDDEIMQFSEKLIKNPEIVALKREEQTLPNIKQYFVECSSRDAKYSALRNLYTGLAIASSIIFTYTKSSAQWLATRMQQAGYEVLLLHSDMTKEDRVNAIQLFKNGHYKVLITTNVCARGIDIPQVSIVINYDPPTHHDTKLADYETYLHRIGRTGRFGKAGIAINLVDSNESLAIMKSIETYFGKPILKLDPSVIEELEAIEKDE